MVMHWYTVSMAKPKLSKWVMPLLGPGQPPRHSLPLMLQCRPWPELVHGAGFSEPTVAITSEEQSHAVSSGQAKHGSPHFLPLQIQRPSHPAGCCSKHPSSCHTLRLDAGKSTLSASTESLWCHTATHRQLCCPHSSTCPEVVAGLVHPALEELLPDDGVDDDHEEDQQGNVEQGHHGLDDGVQDDLEACTKMKGEEVSHFLNTLGAPCIPASPPTSSL